MWKGNVEEKVRLLILQRERNELEKWERRVWRLEEKNKGCRGRGRM